MTPIAVAWGDGIGPEIMSATLFLLKETGAPLEITEVEVGEKVYRRGESSGLSPQAWEIISHSKAFLKGPITTPQGGGFKSLNVTIRTTLGLYANVRPCCSYAPFIETHHPGMDVVIIRENEEDLYMGIEYRHTSETYEASKIMTYSGCQRIIRYAFEYARRHQRRKVTCMTKDNILKFTDGLFHKIFEEIGDDYPELEREHWIIDIGAAKLADTPTQFDVVVLPNLYGDILSDIAAQLTGSVGLAGSANIGPSCAMFEAIHGSAPRRAGKNSANPSGLILASVQMLNHLGHTQEAARLHNAWLCTIEEGIHTDDIFKEGISSQRVGTDAFAKAIAHRLGHQPNRLPSARPSIPMTSLPLSPSPPSVTRQLMGVDLFIEWQGTLDTLLAAFPSSPPVPLTFISNRGVQVWPRPHVETLCSDHWRCRFLSATPIAYEQLIQLLQQFAAAHFTITRLQSLFHFDQQRGFSLPEG